MVAMDAEKVLEAVGERIKEESKLNHAVDLKELSHLVDSYTELLRTIQGN